MNKTNPKVDVFLRQARKWAKEFRELRRIALGLQLTEELKWRLPCYTFENKNIVIIQGFNDYCALMFFKGALLHDPKGMLSQIGEHSQAGRQLRFTDVKQIIRIEPVVKSYIREAIAVEKAGLKVELKKTSDYEIPEEFQSKLDGLPALKKAFESLTPGRQRAYLYYFSAPKQSQTRASRVEKSMRQILKGKGLND